MNQFFSKVAVSVTDLPELGGQHFLRGLSDFLCKNSKPDRVDVILLAPLRILALAFLPDGHNCLADSTRLIEWNRH